MIRQPIFELLLQFGDLMVTINTSKEGVAIPDHLRTEEHVNFVLGAVPTPKLSCDEWGISTPMRFSRRLFQCRFPWGSVATISCEEAIIHFKAAEKVSSDVAASPNKKTKSPESKKEKSERNHLRVIK